jgi:squalene cyclase
VPPVLAFLLFAATPEQRAVDYLAGEVARWQRENRCFSCHNNGDAVRALIAARERGFIVPADALSGTLEWLRSPGRWDQDRGTPGFNNQALAQVQFSAALADATAAGLVTDRQPLTTAADWLARHQEKNGSWKIDTGGVPGAPATYGTALATYIARRTLELAGRSRYAGSIARANRWIAGDTPASLLDAAALLLAMPRSDEVRRKCLALLLGAQTSDGGWGPHLHAPAEPFDTSIVLLALDAIREPSQTARAMARGRAFLISQQQESGGWPATTRPPGAESYAEHISTTAWAAYTLLLLDAKSQ